MRRWDWFGRLADAVTIVASLGALIGLALSGPIQQVIMAAALSALAVAATTVAWFQSRQLHEAAEIVVTGQMLTSSLQPFAGAVDDLTRGHRALAPGSDGQPDPQGFVNRCESACRTAATALQSLTGRTCRVALQELYTTDQPNGQQRAAVRTIATSDRGGATGQASVDWVDENTDFQLLVSGAEYFHSDDLRVDLQEGYRNSHWTSDKLKEWKQTGGYPYLSTIVWPIAVRVDGLHEWEMAGFLSVDSKETEVFDLAIVKPLGAALASAAYTGLSLYGAIKDAQERRSATGKGDNVASS